MSYAIEPEIRATAFVGDGEPIPPYTDGLVLIGDADASRASDDDAAIASAECAEIGEVAVALEPCAREGMLPAFECFASAALTCAGEADAGVGGLECIVVQSGFGQRQPGCSHDGAGRCINAEAHAGRAGEAAA